MKCERCGKVPVGYNLHDYCAVCGKNLCDRCMGDGCCGTIPAKSGQDADDKVEINKPPKRKDTHQ